MNANPNLAAVAALIGDPSRAAMLVSLLGGKSLPAGELARFARISPQTASAHLTKLLAGGLLVREAYGRHKYYRLASDEVGHALEALQVISPAQPVRSLRESNQLQSLQFARTCYDHLAGKLGVALTDRLLALKLLEPAGEELALSAAGEKTLRALGVDVVRNPKSRRCFARRCLDWSERRHHLAGSLGASLAKRLFELAWLERIPDGRAVRITAAGSRGLLNEFGLVLDSD